MELFWTDTWEGGLKVLLPESSLVIWEVARTVPDVVDKHFALIQN